MSDTSRASSGVSLPMFVFLAKALPSINQYSRSPPAFGITTSGLKGLSASSIYSQVRSVSTTWASASITAMLRSSFPGLYPAYRLLSDLRLDQGEQFHSVYDYIADWQYNIHFEFEAILRLDSRRFSKPRWQIN